MRTVFVILIDFKKHSEHPHVVRVLTADIQHISHIYFQLRGILEEINRICTEYKQFS
jgi:hypothetical protein